MFVMLEITCMWQYLVCCSDLLLSIESTPTGRGLLNVSKSLAAGHSRWSQHTWLRIQQLGRLRIADPLYSQPRWPCLNVSDSVFRMCQSLAMLCGRRVAATTHDLRISHSLPVYVVRTTSVSALSSSCGTPASANPVAHISWTHPILAHAVSHSKAARSDPCMKVAAP